MATVLDDWKRHALASETMRTQGFPDYHQMTGYNFAQNFPAIAESGIGTGLAKGYQYGQELGRWGLGTLGFGKDIDLSDALKTAKEQSDLNILGFTGEGFDMDEYTNFMNKFDYTTPKKGTIAFDPNNPRVNRGFIDPITALGILKTKGSGVLKNYIMNRTLSDIVRKQTGKQWNRMLRDKTYSEKNLIDVINQVAKKTGAVDADDMAFTPKKTYTSPARPHGGGGGGLGAGQSPTGGDVAGTPFYQGGRVGFSKGGIVSLWQELSNL